MKLGQFFKKMVGGSVILAALAGPIFTSCYDDSKLWNEMDKLNDRVTSLEERLNDELAALQYMLGADAKISDVKWNETASKWEFTLADGSSLNFVPPTAENLQSLITTVEENGVKYWATYGADGTASALTDAQGNKYPVSVTPQVKTEGNTTYLSLDGTNWLPVSVSNPAIFTDVEVVYSDNYTDEEEADGYMESPMYAVFTLADGNTITLTLDGVGMLQFVRPSPHGRPMPLDNLFIAKGETFAAALQVSDITEVIFSVPTGWIVEEGETTTSFMGTQYELSIKAPSYEDVVSKSAAQGGYIKVIGVCEGGKTITSKLYVSCSPFENFSVRKNLVNITEYYGWDKMFYGITKVDEFDKEAIMSTIMSEMDPDNWRYTYESFWAGSFYEPVPVESLLEDFKFSYGEKYILWTVPVMMNPDTYEYYCVENTIETCEFVYQDIKVEATETSISDIKLKVQMNGVDKYFAGFVAHSYYYNGSYMDETLNEFNYCLSAGESYYYYPTLYTYSDVYEGSVEEFVKVSEGHNLIPGETYTLWIAPYVEGKTSYTLDDLYTFDLATAGLKYDETCTLNIKLENVTPDNLKYNALQVEIEAPDAALTYYSWVNLEDYSLIPNHEEYVLNNGQLAESTALATLANLTPNTSMRLLVLPIASDGRYGKVTSQVFATSEYVYNTMTTTIQIVGTPSVDGTKISLSADGEATKFIYWAGKSDDSKWLSTFGGTKEKFEAYVAISPEDYRLSNVLSENASEIEITTNEYGNYTIVAVAVNSDKVISHAVQYDFEVAFPLGNYVAAKDQNGNENAEWAAKKPTVNITTEAFGDFTQVTWSVTNVPEGFTAQTLICHDDNLTNYPTGRDIANYFLTDEYVGLENVAASEDTHMTPYASPGYNVWVIIKDAEGNYYEPYKYECNIQGGGGFAQ